MAAGRRGARAPATRRSSCSVSDVVPKLTRRHGELSLPFPRASATDAPSPRTRPRSSRRAAAAPDAHRHRRQGRPDQRGRHRPAAGGHREPVNVVDLPDGTARPPPRSPTRPCRRREGRADLVFVLPALKAGESVAVRPATLELRQGPAALPLRREADAGYTDLRLRRPAGAAVRQRPARRVPKDARLDVQAVPPRLRPDEGKTLLTSGRR